MDDIIESINRRMNTGWEPSKHMWRAVADRCAKDPMYRDMKVWGVRVLTGYSTDALEYEVVANPQFFHPKWIVGTNLTYDEAEAFKKILGGSDEKSSRSST